MSECHIHSDILFFVRIYLMDSSAKNDNSPVDGIVKIYILLSLLKWRYALTFVSLARIMRLTITFKVNFLIV